MTRRRPEPPDEPPVKATNRLKTVVNPQAADAFMENLVRIVDEIEAAREVDVDDGANEKNDR
jgi:hypothetical protein